MLEGLVGSQNDGTLAVVQTVLLSNSSTKPQQGKKKSTGILGFLLFLFSRTGFRAFEPSAPNFSLSTAFNWNGKMKLSALALSNGRYGSAAPRSLRRDCGMAQRGGWRL